MLQVSFFTRFAGCGYRPAHAIAPPPLAAKIPARRRRKAVGELLRALDALIAAAKQADRAKRMIVKTAERRREVSR